MTNTALHSAHTLLQEPVRRRRPGCARLPRRVGLGVVGALGITCALAAPAWAHDTLIASTPEEGEALSESPEEVILEFSGDGLTVGEEITNTIWVVDEDGENWEGETEVEGSTMSTELEEELPDGEYEILYRVVYSDGHSEELDFTFEVDAAEEAEEDDGGAEEAEDVAPEQDEAGAADEDPDDAPEEDAPAEETETAVEEGAVPTWALWSLVGAAVVVAALIAVTVRRKLKE